MLKFSAPYMIDKNLKRSYITNDTKSPKLILMLFCQDKSEIQVYEGSLDALQAFYDNLTPEEKAVVKWYEI